MVAVLAMVVLGVVGCGVPVVPVARNDAPLAMTLRDGEVWFHWCGPGTLTFKYLLVDYTVFSAPQTNGPAAKGAGVFEFTPGDEFSSTSPPAGLVYSTSREIPIADDLTRVFVHAGEGAHELSFFAIFDWASPSTFREGTWLYPSGKTGGEPCGMLTASPAAER